RARVHVYDHLDAGHLERLLERERANHANALIVSESLFSMDGDTAPLGMLRTLSDRYDCGLVVDEAHAFGVLGPAGRGLCAEAGVTPDVLMVTLGKALGAAGAFVAGSESLIRLLENRARSYVFSTAPPPALAAAAIAAIDLVEPADALRSKVLH